MYPVPIPVASGTIDIDSSLLLLLLTSPGTLEPRRSVTTPRWLRSLTSLFSINCAALKITLIKLLLAAVGAAARPRSLKPTACRLKPLNQHLPQHYFPFSYQMNKVLTSTYVLSGIIPCFMGVLRPVSDRGVGGSLDPHKTR